MGEYIRDVIMWIATTIIVTFAIDKTGDINSLAVIIAPVAITVFNLFVNS